MKKEDEALVMTYSITEPLLTRMAYFKRTIVMNELWDKTIEYMCIDYRLKPDYKDIYSKNVYNIDYTKSDGFLVKIKSDFIISNGTSTMIHGEIKDNLFQIIITGPDRISLSKQIKKDLEDFSFEGAPYLKEIKSINEAVSYIRQNEIIDATETLIKNTLVFLVKHKISNDADEDFDEDE